MLEVAATLALLVLAIAAPPVPLVCQGSHAPACVSNHALLLLVCTSQAAGGAGAVGESHMAAPCIDSGWLLRTLSRFAWVQRRPASHRPAQHTQCCLTHPASCIVQVIEVHLPQSSRSHARASFDGRHTMRMLVGVAQQDASCALVRLSCGAACTRLAARL